MISEHQEIESKLLASNVDVDEFRTWLMQYNITSFKVVSGGPDHYYENGTKVIRHRIDPKTSTSEVTFKKRKSDSSIRDRQEVDLTFGGKTTALDIEAFFEGIGFTHAFTLVKDAGIFELVISPQLTLTVSIYDVGRQISGKIIDSKRYIEVEAVKGSMVTVKTAKKHVQEWTQNIVTKFKVSEPLNESLYEIFSGKKYEMV